MYIQRYSKDWLTPARLDTDHYNPDAIEAIKKIQTIGEYETFASSGLTWGFGAYELCNQIVEDESPNAPGFIKIGDLTPPFIDESSVMSVTLNTHQILNIARVEAGDVIVSIAGTIGASAIIPESNRLYSANQAIVKYRANDKIFNNYYVVAYTLSVHFQLIATREAGGAVQKNLYLYNFDTIPIPKIEALAQKYIGDKVRQAERLRAWAKVLDNQITNFHLKFIPSQEQLNLSKKTRMVSSRKLTERLDAHFYPGVVDEYLQADGVEVKELGLISMSLFNGQTQDETDSTLFCMQITVTNLSKYFVKGEPRNVIPPNKFDRFVKKHDLLICNAAHNKSYIGREISYVHGEKKWLPSTEVMVIRIDRKKIPASFVRTYLLTKLGFLQIQSTIRGITAHSYPGDVKTLDIVIPNVPQQSQEGWFDCDNLMSKAGLAHEVATYLTTCAKYLIEALIESNLTETQLIQAQQALESGDNTLDRQILSRLKTDGFDGEDESLFPDLDQLYDLLKQAEEALSA